jgi:putative transposase
MPNYRRAYIPGGMFFFTLVTERRAAIFAEARARSLLRQAIVSCRVRWPFRIEAIVLLPEHLHAIWSLPPGDAEYSIRWSWIKKEFAKPWLAEGGSEQPISASRRATGDGGLAAAILGTLPSG